MPPSTPDRSDELPGDTAFREAVEIVGLTAESHLDAAESVAPLLTFLFAVHGRVRPFNRHLGFDLRTEPLGDGWLAADALLPRLDELVASGSLASQAALFCDVEALARAHGHGHVIDTWEPDVPSLRVAPRLSTEAG